MRFLIDACVDPRILEIFPAHEVRTASDLGWHRKPDHELLRLANQEFDVLVTIDRGFEFEHNLQGLRVAIMIVHVAKNKIGFYRQLADGLLGAIATIAPGNVLHVPPFE